MYKYKYLNLVFVSDQEIKLSGPEDKLTGSLNQQAEEL